MLNNISLKAIGDGDQDFLFRVYADTRAEELAQTGWPAEQQLDFLKMQFDAQHKHYTEYYPEASLNVIMLGGVSIGRLYVSRWENQIRIVDIALLSQYCGQKIGSQLLVGLMDEAKSKLQEVSIHVEKNNPAMQWYLRLGFVFLEDKGVYSLMKTAFFVSGKPGYLEPVESRDD